jgi:hypothetical protein
MARKAKYMYDKHTTLYQWCVDNKRNYIGIVQRIKFGDSIDEAIKNDEEGNCKSVSYTYNGMSLRQYCKENKLDYNTILMRIHRGRSVEEAINLVDRRFKR